MSDETPYICSDYLKDTVGANLGEFSAIEAEEEGLRRAAVAVVIADVGLGANIQGIANPTRWSDEAAIFLTRRSENLRNHPGQWALPGGKLEANESNSQCALRELEEEVGVMIPSDNVLGSLDDFVTRSGFAIRPIVIWGGKGLTTQINRDEVASLHRIPVSEFLRLDAPMLSTVNTSEFPILRMPVGKDAIAAPTAAILYQFREVCILGRPTRVAHYEQPRFAWE
jgi:8-oxo-dGTP pyrophosphatase MutT (NUDIX family)